MKKIFASALIALLTITAGYYAIGYATASRKAAECEEIAFQEAVAKNIRGFNMSGKNISVQRSKVISSISPFQVEVTYAVPRDLHVTIFVKKFHISFLGEITQEKLEVFYPV